MSVTFDLRIKLRMNSLLGYFNRMSLIIKNILNNSNVTEDQKFKLSLLSEWGSRFSVAAQILKSLDLPDFFIFENLTDAQKTALLVYAKELLFFWKYGLFFLLLERELRKEFNIIIFSFHVSRWLNLDFAIKGIMPLYNCEKPKVLESKNYYTEKSVQLLLKYYSIAYMFHWSEYQISEILEKSLPVRDYALDGVRSLYRGRAPGLKSPFPPENIETEMTYFLHKNLEEAFNMDIVSEDPLVNNIKKEFLKIENSKKYYRYWENPEFFIVKKNLPFSEEDDEEEE